MKDGACRAPNNENRKELWLQLTEARQAADLTQEELARRIGVSQAQVARIEKRGYDCYTLNTLRRYVEALGHGFTLEVKIHQHLDYQQEHKVSEKLQIFVQKIGFEVEYPQSNNERPDAERTDPIHNKYYR